MVSTLLPSGGCSFTTLDGYFGRQPLTSRLAFFVSLHYQEMPTETIDCQYTEFKNPRDTMDTTAIQESLAQEMITEWSFVPTGNGLLIITNWRLPNMQNIEIHIRRIGEREDLYLVTDGGELFNMFYLMGLDISSDRDAMDIISRVAQGYGAKLVDGQMVKGANEGDFQGAIRRLLEAVKEASFLLWGRVPEGHFSKH